jgi:hypothetical protein
MEIMMKERWVHMV